MKIETKFEIGDRVWFIGDNMVKHLKITCIDIKVLLNEVTLLYFMGD